MYTKVLHRFYKIEYYSNGEPEDVTEKYETWRNIPDELKSDCHVHMDSGFSSDGSINLSKIWPVLIKIMEKHGNEYTRIDINYEVDDGYLYNPVVIGRRPFTPAETKEIEDKKQLELENKKLEKERKKREAEAAKELKNREEYERLKQHFEKSPKSP